MTTTTFANKLYVEQHQVDSNPTTHIEQSSLEYLHTAFLLYEYKQTYTKKEYRALLEEYGWDKGSTEERRSLRIAENFQAFISCPEHLAVLPISVLLRLCSVNYKILIDELKDIPIGGLTCGLVLKLIEERRLFLKAMNQEKKDGNWRSTPDGNRYYTFGKIFEDDHQTGVFTEKLIEELGLSPQRIVRMAIADLYEKHQAEIGKAEIDDFVEPIPVEEDLTSDSEDGVNDAISWESKQQEFETLWQRDTEEYTGSEYLEEPQESDIDCEEDEFEVLGDTPSEILVTNPTPTKDAEILAGILRQASNYADVRSGLYQYQLVKEEAWQLLSNSERKSVCEMLPEPIKKLSHARREGLIVNFYEMESGEIYKIFTTDCPLIEKTVSVHSLDKLLEDLRARQNYDCN
ncbi:hypothetical protein H6G81_21160 [Scytonema hofmannii FACHB-248]|uniref:Uncharacterized protein n=1 Tax=Scytonema hofmannii FACHB-248 TaxID=1842502 RepID=A0ABR8GW48_9CYAN|nr:MULTISPECIES: hypothetical protein [Nostocales]MBD2606973.1 hypothetical protein [Scytonema hofmannii FACHB-248]